MAWPNTNQLIDTLLPISQIVDRFISDPAEVLSINQAVDVKLISIDVEKKRISLTMKG